MSLSSRWSIFSRDVKEEKKYEKVKQECVENGDMHNNGEEEEVVFSTKEETVFTVNEKGVNEKGVNEKGVNEKGVELGGEQEVKMLVESSCNSYNVTECADMDVYEKVNEYLKMRTVINDGSDKNSHYRGVHTEVIPTMPVLFIEEFVPTSYNFGSASVTDWRAYVYYDSLRGVYVVNGTRRRHNEQGVGTERRYPDICMTFKSRRAMAFYLRRSMCSRKHNLSITMYSMYRSVIHLSTCGAMPSFHSIHNCRSKFRSELFGYDDCRVSLKEFESYLKVLKEGVDDGYLFRPTNTAMTV